MPNQDPKVPGSLYTKNINFLGSEERPICPLRENKSLHLISLLVIRTIMSLVIGIAGRLIYKLTSTLAFDVYGAL